MDLLSLGKTEGVLINAHKYLQDGCQGKCDRLFSVVQSYRTKSNGHKPKQRELHLNIISLRVAKHWNRLPWEVMEFSSLQTHSKPSCMRQTC